MDKPYVTSIERIPAERDGQKWLKAINPERYEEAYQRGYEEGYKEGMLFVLALKFGKSALSLKDKIEKITDRDTLDTFKERIRSSASLEELQAFFDRPSPL